MGADPVLDAVGLPRNDPHPAVVHADRASADLRHRRGEALANSGAAGHQLDRAGAVHGDAGAVQWSEPAFLIFEHGTDADRENGPAARSFSAWPPPH
jgi:hypothetical protein